MMLGMDQNFTNLENNPGSCLSAPRSVIIIAG